MMNFAKNLSSKTKKNIFRGWGWLTPPREVVGYENKLIKWWTLQKTNSLYLQKQKKSFLGGDPLIYPLMGVVGLTSFQYDNVLSKLSKKNTAPQHCFQYYDVLSKWWALQKTRRLYLQKQKNSFLGGGAWFTPLGGLRGLPAFNMIIY